MSENEEVSRLLTPSDSKDDWFDLLGSKGPMVYLVTDDRPDRPPKLVPCNWPTSGSIKMASDIAA